MSNKYLMSVRVGPTLVRQFEAKLREAGVDVAEVGTERVYVRAEGSEPSAAAHNVRVDVFRRYGTDYGLLPMLVRKL